MKTVIRALALLLAGTLCLSCIACSETKQEESSAPDETTALAPVQETEEEEAETRIPAGFEIQNLDDKVFHIFSRGRNDGGDWSVHDMTAEETTGDVLNDAIFNRNEFLADTYHFTIEVTETPNHVPTAEIANLIASADQTYDTFAVSAAVACQLSMDGALLDLRALPYLSLDDEWWSPSLCSPLTIAGHQYMTTGDISVVPKEGVRAFYFNKDLQGNYQLESPYDLVEAGTWTWDRMFSMMDVAKTDLNGDGQMDANDRYGLQGQGLYGTVLFEGSGEPLVSKDTDDRWVYSAQEERCVNAVIQLSDLISTRKDNIFASGDWRGMLKMFENSQALFYTEVMLHIVTMRGYEIDFGIIPTPKMDEIQKNYSHYIDCQCNIVYTLPITLSVPETQAYILEAICYASHSTITPAYYDICLKTKFSRDEESSKMLDIIFTSYHMDLAELYGWGNLIGSVSSCITGGGNISSTLASLEKMVSKSIKVTINSFAKKNNWD